MRTILEAQALHIGYAKKRAAPTVIAADISLSAAAGQLICLLGVNGAGKSTLLRTLAKLQAPLGGRVVLSGRDIRDYSAQQMATQLSLVTTERPHLGLLSGYALVALGRHPHTNWLGRLSAHDQAMIRWAVDAVGGTALATRPVMQLSDGQRQKFMIARALAQESALMMLDEPTAFLDLPRRAEIMHLLRHLAAQTGRAIIVATHDLDLALRNADRLWLIADGAVQVGTPEDLVLSGQFEAAFAAEGVGFDRATGTFTVQQIRQRTVAVHGQGVAYLWTQRALQRAGYAVSSNGHSPAVRVCGDDNAPYWEVHQDGEPMRLESIEALLAQVSDMTATDG